MVQLVKDTEKNSRDDAKMVLVKSSCNGSKIVHFLTLLLFSLSFLAFASLYEMKSTLDNFVLIWWILQFIAISMCNIVEFRKGEKYSDSKVEAKISPINAAGVFLILWSICGVIGYASVQTGTDSEWKSYQWIGALTWSIVSIIIVLIRIFLNLYHSKSNRI